MRIWVPAAVLAAFVWAGLVAAPWPVLAASLALGLTLVCLAVVDVSCFRLPDALTLPLVVGGLAMAFVLPGARLGDHLVGAGLGWGALTVLAWAYRRWRGVAGIGQGDAKLLGAAGAWLGWAALPSVLLLACLAAFLWVGLVALRRGRAAAAGRIAFGAPLCLAFWVVWLHGPLAI